MKEFTLAGTVQDPAVFAEGRLNAHADFVAYRSLAELAAGESSLRQSLNGIWKFHYARNPAAAPEGFFKPGYDVSGWETIRVPAHIQMEGCDAPAYVNTQYPWDGREDLTPGREAPELFNPVADYVTEFTLPERFRNAGTVCVSFQGVESGFALWLNGVYIGYSEDSFTPAEFDLSGALQNGVNRLAVRVFKWTTGSWFEDQDFYRFSGIFRDVYLYLLPETAVTDLSVVPTLDDAFTEGTVAISARTRGKGKLRLTLSRNDAALASEEIPFEDGTAAAELRVEQPALWSAEDPNLYTLLAEVFDGEGKCVEIIPQELGFRRFELKDGLMLLNGRRIVFKGVNRHDFNSATGRVPDPETLLHDILTMKRNNINAIRTCHYPDDSRLYALCDRYGLYVIDENNMETHGTWDALLRGKAGPEYVVPKDYEEFAPLLLDRVESLYQRDKNHPCVLVWSCGNESYGGRVIWEMSQRFRALDSHRLVHYEGIFHDRSYPDTSDFESQMYTPVAQIEQFLAENPNGKPLILCEYTHAMGNSCGAMHKYTDLSDREPRYQGGFIWDWADQSLYRKNRFGEWYQAYGGDCGERPTDYEFSGNGIVYGGDHAPSPKMQEVKYNYQNLSIDFEGEEITVHNKHLFTDASAFDAWAVLLADGTKRLRLPMQISVPPLSVGRFPLPEGIFAEKRAVEEAAEALGRPAPEFAVTVSFTLKTATAWAGAGHEVAFGQTALPHVAAPFACAAPLTVVRGKHNLGARGSGFHALFSSLNPGLASYVYGGRELLRGSPMPNFWRAPTDNDRGSLMPQRCAQWKLASLYAVGKLTPFEDMSPEVEQGSGSVTVRYRYYLPTAPAAECRVSYEVFGDGTVKATLTYKAVEGLCDPPEFGLMFRLDADFDRVRWYGLGPEETYADRQRGARLGVYEKSVSDCMARYLRPQESGNHCAVRWARVTDRKGRGMEFFGDNLSVNVLPYTPHELENAFHAYELPRPCQTVVRVALAQMSVGGDDSWGSPTHPEYLLPAGKDLEFSFYFRGI